MSTTSSAVTPPGPKPGAGAGGAPTLKTDETPRPQTPYYNNGSYDPTDAFLELEDVAYFTGDISSLPAEESPPVTARARLLTGANLSVTITRSALDPCVLDSAGRTYVPLYRATYQAPGETANLCGNENYDRYAYESMSACDRRCSDADAGIKTASALREMAYAIPGYWDRATGQYWDRCPDSTGNHVIQCFSLACATGVAGKCVHWGYPPTDAQLKPLYVACVKAARAGYNNNGTAYTCDATTVDFFDNRTIQRPEQPWPVEAVWDDRGVVCLNHTRFSGCDGEIADGGGVDAAACDAGLFDDGGFVDGSFPDASVVAVRSVQRDGGTACVSEGSNCPSGAGAGTWVCDP